MNTVFVLSACLNVVLIGIIFVWLYETSIGRLVKKWDKQLDEFFVRKHALDDLIMLGSGSFGLYNEALENYDSLLSALEEKLEEAREKREKRLREHNIVNGDTVVLENLIRIIKDNKEDIQEAQAIDFWLAEKISELEMDVKERTEYITLQIHRGMERIKEFILREDYKAAGDLLIPVFERLFLRGIKSIVMTNINEYNEEDSAVEFGRGSDEVIECLEVKTIDERIGNVKKKGNV